MDMILKTLGVVSAAALLVSCTATTGGTKGAMANSSAGGKTAEGSDIRRCAQTLGTLAVDEDPDAEWRRYYRNSTGLSSVEPLVRQMVQESNCFIIVAGAGTKQQRSIDRMMQYSRDSGEIRSGSNVQGGQGINADYVLFPEILYAGQDSGGTDAGVGGLLRRTTGLRGLGGLGIGTDKKSTQVNMSVWSTRTRAQLASTTASKTATDFSVKGFLGGWAGAGAFRTATKTPEGKATVSALVDAYNSMVVSLENYEAQTFNGGATGAGGSLGDIQ